MFVIEFAPPMSGIEGEFNTVRLGGTWGRRLSGGESVLLMDKKKAEVIGKAKVGQVVVGRLNELAKVHAASNHNQKGLDSAEAPQRLIEAMKKRYGPQMVRENSLCTVIYMRLENEKDIP